MSQISPARVCAYAVVRRVFEQDAFADRALRAEAEGLDGRDRALATQLAYGTVQRRATLDHVIEQLAGRSVRKLDPPVLAALRLGLFQLLFLDGIAEHAAVNESVELCKRSAHRGAGFVNAVLRRATREGRGIVEGLGDGTPAAAALKYSVPEWIASLWWDELGPSETIALLGRVNEPAESALRVNLLRATVEDVTARMPVRWRAAGPDLPEGLVLEEPFDVHGSELFAEGLVMPQARSSMLVTGMLGPEPGERVLDLCAAPGAKTTHIAAMVGVDGSVVAVERHQGRADALRRTCESMGAANVEVRTGDAAARHEGAPFDRVLVDPPCSGLGTLQSRPDIRWHRTAEAIDELVGLQGRILAAGADATAPGGTLVYSVCTISRREGPGVVDAFLESRPDYELESRRQLLPHRDGTDGFWIARLSRTGGYATNQ